MRTLVIVDGANVVGSVPDGWCRDRRCLPVKERRPVRAIARDSAAQFQDASAARAVTCDDAVVAEAFSAGHRCSAESRSRVARRPKALVAELLGLSANGQRGERACRATRRGKRRREGH